VLKAARRTVAVDPLLDQPVSVDGRATSNDADFDEDLIREERHAALLAGFAELSDQHRALLTLLVADPQPSYEEISERLGMPIGGIGPTRARALDRLRRSPALAALLSEDLTNDTTKRIGR
jgi:DNA-directed RNA polymerase specialized sigma24 family protein